MAAWPSPTSQGLARPAVDRAPTRGRRAGLVVSERDRRSGALAILLCDDDDRLVQPVMITELEPMAHEDDRADAISVFTGVFTDFVGDHGSMIAAVARRDCLNITEDDRVWARAAYRAAAGAVRLLGVHLVTSTGSREVPLDRAA